MHTITFYSYKGGVGRSLLVANTAKYLSTLGKSVVAIDLDLEAPGLNYKFELDDSRPRLSPGPGVVDILTEFIEKREFPDSLDKYVADVDVPAGAGAIRIMRAGVAPEREYWRQLSRISWHDLFFDDDAAGVPFFLELKELISKHLAPDFLLIDARTGITEIGGLATSLLPDTVVCLALASREHLEGLRAAMQAISHAEWRASHPIRLLAAISRLSGVADEDDELASIKTFLETPFGVHGIGIELEDVYPLHSEPLLHAREQLLIGGANSPHELPLLRDYLRIFAKIIPAEDIRPHVGALVMSAVSRLLEDPDRAQSELEALTAYCADQEAYRALLRLYVLRKVGLEKVLSTAFLMRELEGPRGKVDPILIDVVSAAFKEYRGTELQKKYAGFAEDVVRATGFNDIVLALGVVSAYVPERRDRAVRLLLDYLESVDAPAGSMVTRLIDLARPETDGWALEIVERYKGRVQNPEFQIARARFVVRSRDRDVAESLLNDNTFSLELVQAIEPIVGYRLLKLADFVNAEVFLQESLEMAAERNNISQVRSLAEVYVNDGRMEELEYSLLRRLGPEEVRDILGSVRKGSRRRRLALP